MYIHIFNAQMHIFTYAQDPEDDEKGFDCASSKTLYDLSAGSIRCNTRQHIVIF